MRGILSLVSTILLSGAPAPAADVLTLEEAVATALEHNHSLGAADADADASAARAAEARGALLPRITLGETFSRTDNPVLVFGGLLRQESFGPENFDVGSLNRPAPLNNFESRITVEQPLWLGGALRHGAEAADQARLASSAGRERTRQQVVHAVVDAYTAAVVAEAALANVREARATARANSRLVADLHEGGLVVRSDLLQARVRESELEEQVARAEASFAVSRAALNLVMGRDLDRELALPGGLAPPAPADADLEELVRRARESRPDLEAAEARERSAERSIRAARAERLPWVSLAGSYEANAEDGIGDDGTNWSVFANVRWSLFDRGTRARVRRAEAESRKAQRLRRALEQSAELEVRRAFHEARAAGKRIGQAADAVLLAEENLRIVRDRYREGLTTLVELLGAETALTEARTRELDALRDAWLTDAGLRLATGRL